MNIYIDIDLQGFGVLKNLTSIEFTSINDTVPWDHADFYIINFNELEACKALERIKFTGTIYADVDQLDFFSLLKNLQEIVINLNDNGFSPVDEKYLSFLANQNLRIIDIDMSKLLINMMFHVSSLGRILKI